MDQLLYEAGMQFQYRSRFLDNFLVTKSKKGYVTVSANFRIHSDSAWESLSIVAPPTALKTLARLSDYDRRDVLNTLISYYAASITQKPLPRGVNTELSIRAWLTARVFTPWFLAWAENSANKRTKPFKVIASCLRKEGHGTSDPKLVACYLVKRNIENSGHRWPGRDPCLNPSLFLKKLGKCSPEWNVFYLPRYSARMFTLIEGVGTGSVDFDFSPDKTAELITYILDGDYLLASYMPETELLYLFHQGRSLQT